MAIKFEDAHNIIARVATERAASFAQDEELSPLDQCVGRTTKVNITSPVATPTFDSVAINGYAVIASQTSQASAQTPLALRCMATMSAGGPPLEIDDRIIDGKPTCVEVKICAPFPVARSSGRAYDAIVPREHATILSEGGDGRVLLIERPPLTSWHKRIAGSDFRQGDMILEKGTSIAPKHIMALSSVGIRQIVTTRSVRVGVLSIGSELASTAFDQQALQYKIADANGPYLTAAIREMGEDATYLGAIPDDPQIIATFLVDNLQTEQYDIVIATGGSSTTRTPCPTFTVLKSLNAKIHFHGIAMQPGSSVLLAELPESEDPGNQDAQTPASYPSSSASSQPLGFESTMLPSLLQTPPKTPASNYRKRRPILFSLPGSPIAAACTFRFIVTPYIRHLIGMAPEREILAKVAVAPASVIYHPQSKPDVNEVVVEGSATHDVFRHAILKSQHEGVSVEVSRERSVAKASPFASSNCWIHVPRGRVGVGHGDLVRVFAFCSPRS